MNFANTSERSSPSLSSIAPSPPLARILERIRSNSAEMSEIATKLNLHADHLHGPAPEEAARQDCHPVRSGIIGAIEDALDELQSVHSEVAMAAGRNCTLI